MSSDSDHGWRSSDREAVINHRYLRVDREKLTRPDGVVLDPFWLIHEPEWVAILALTTDGDCLLVEQYRRGVDTLTLELPAGDIDPGESPSAAAARELLEETGYRCCEEPRPLGCWPVEPARQTALGHVVWATCEQHTAPQEEAAGVHLRLVPADSLIATCDDGRIRHPIHALAIYRAAHLGLLGA